MAKLEDVFLQKKSADFLHGKFTTEDGHTIIVQNLSVYSDGVVVDTALSTNHSDLFLAEWLRWMAEITEGTITPVGLRYYMSQIEMRMENALDRCLVAFHKIGPTVAIHLNEYGIKAPPYEGTGLRFSFDQLGAVGAQPCEFLLERRLNVPFGDNLWFTQAPLKTGDHIKLLKTWAESVEQDHAEVH